MAYFWWGFGGVLTVVGLIAGVRGMVETGSFAGAWYCLVLAGILCALGYLEAIWRTFRDVQNLLHLQQGLPPRSDTV